jgi:hypothetical protein
MVFDPHPPYTILANKHIDFPTMQRLVRFARYWDLVANSGRFTHTLPVLLGATPFEHFMAFADWLYANTDATHRIALDRLAAMVQKWLVQRGMEAQEAAALVASDVATGKKQGHAHETPKAVAPQRQVRHLAA